MAEDDTMEVTEKSIVKTGERQTEKERFLVLAAEDAERAASDGLELNFATSYRGFRRFFLLLTAVVCLFIGTNYAIRTRPGSGTDRRITGVAFTGTCQPSGEVRVSAQALGTVSEVLVEPGQLVEAGQVMMRMDDQEAEAALRAAALQRSTALHNLSSLRSNYETTKSKFVISQQQQQLLPSHQLRDSPERARATYEQALRNFNRVSSLVHLGVMAEQELDSRAMELRVAKDDLENAEKLAAAAKEVSENQIAQVTAGTQVDRQGLLDDFQHADLNFRECQRRVALAEVKSPVRAVVAEVSAHVGERLSAGVLLARLAQLHTMVVDVPVAAAMITQLHPHQTAVIQLPTIPVREVQGSVRLINPLPSANMTHSVLVEFANKDLTLLAGQPAKVTFEEQ